MKTENHLRFASNMKLDTTSKLPWNFEAFRNYLNFENLQQAAASLIQFNGKPLFTDSSLMKEFTDLLVLRTGLPWVPKRTVSEGVIYNIEGSVFRNKARVFTSLYICDPRCLREDGNLIITDLGLALGLGYLRRIEFYKEIIARYEYPHPAYHENWEAWTRKKSRLKPLVFILDILVKIFELDGQGEVSSAEIAEFAHPQPYHTQTQRIAEQILNARNKKISSKRRRSDDIDRKINDLMGFLCISGVTFYRENNIKINLLDKDKEEQAWFWEKRRGAINKTEEIKNYIREALK